MTPYSAMSLSALRSDRKTPAGQWPEQTLDFPYRYPLSLFSDHVQEILGSEPVASVNSGKSGPMHAFGDILTFMQETRTSEVLPRSWFPWPGSKEGYGFYSMVVSWAVGNYAILGLRCHLASYDLYRYNSSSQYQAAPCPGNGRVSTAGYTFGKNHSPVLTLSAVEECAILGP